jgi:hypothetical protein
MAHQPSSPKAGFSTGWLHWLACLAPMAAVAVIFLFNIPVSSVVLIGLMMACMASHLFMMRHAGHSHASHNHASHNHESREQSHLPPPTAGRRLPSSVQKTTDTTA